jgi:hypothetical protein
VVLRVLVYVYGCIVENYQHYHLHGCGLLGSEIHGSENSHATEVKCLNIRKKKQNFIRKNCKINVKAAENQNFPAFILYFPVETI